MQWLGRLLVAVPVLSGMAIAGVLWGLPRLNDYQVQGEIILPGLIRPVTVIRDEKGMAYVRASNVSDAIRVQGFVTAQDRLFQMQVTRLLAQGRISELLGEGGRALDTRYRTIGLHRIARRHAGILGPESRAFFQDFVDGVNAFISQFPDDVHLEFTLAGIKAEPWTVTDSLSVLYYMGWSHSANLRSEILSQMLVEKVGSQRAQEIFPLNFHPGEQASRSSSSSETRRTISSIGLRSELMLGGLLDSDPHRLGSNNWVTTSALSAGDAPILAGDPHLDARVLPGVWYPVGLITPEFRAVGANVAGLPGIAIGRTDRVATAMTVSYSDVQDLYIETLDPEDPERYLEGGVSRPFQIIDEVLRISDASAEGGFRQEPIRIRLTERGPVVSDVLTELQTRHVLTLRWAPAEAMASSIGLRHLLSARSVDDVHRFAAGLTMLGLNLVFADIKGNIGWRVSGVVPIRTGSDGAVPRRVAEDGDDWIGWIPYDEMPHATNPARGWLGTANHKTVDADYPHYLSSYFSPSYRYRRMVELLDTSAKRGVDDHWQYQRDIMNPMARDLAPVMATALAAHEDTQAMADVLQKWSYNDDAESPAPAIFQSVYRKFASRVFEDELGSELTAAMLGSWYFWHQRLEQMIREDDSPWFDDVGTPGQVESRDELFHLAGVEGATELRQRIGGGPRNWLWGKLHRIEFVNPLRRQGFGKSILGGQMHSMGGSGETLYRGWYEFDDPAWVTHSASLRMVADLGDPDKIVAVIPGGVTGRTFHPHLNDQVADFMSGKKRHWWFSDQAIDRNAKHVLVLVPE